MQITGYVTEVDKWGRLTLMTPLGRTGKDIDGTTAKLAEIKVEAKAYTPIRYNTFVVRPDEKTIWMDEKKARCKPADLIQKMIRMNIEIRHYDFTAVGKGKGVSLFLVEATALV